MAAIITRLMELPKAVPATPQEAATMLATQRDVERQRQRHLHTVDEKARLNVSADHMKTLRTEAETLEIFHTTPIPPGYVVIFTVDGMGRTIYSLRVPPGVTDDPILVAEDMRIVLAEAWGRHYRRMPDELPDALERLMREPPEPRSHLWRTLWEMALHHLAYYELTFALNFAGRDASTAALNELSVASGSLEARRVGRLAHLLGAWDSEDPMRASKMFIDDPQSVLPWISLFSSYMNEVDPAAGRWWSQIGAKSIQVPTSIKETERRVASATGRAWAATYMMTMACATEFAIEPPNPPELAEQTLREGLHTGGRIQALGVLPRSMTTYSEVMTWAKRLLHKSSPRLLKILGRQFPHLGARTHLPS